MTLKFYLSAMLLAQLITVVNINCFASEDESIAAMPSSVVECVTQLKKIWSSEIIQTIRDDSEKNIFKYNRTLGADIRQRWLRGRSDSALAQFFLSRGVKHPDDMSSIILHSLWRSLHSVPINLDKQVEERKRLEQRLYEMVLTKETKLSSDIENYVLKFSSGGSLKLQDLMGKVVILANFTIGSNAVESYNQLQKTFGTRDVHLIGLLSPGSPDENNKQRERFINIAKPNFPVVMETNEEEFNNKLYSLLDLRGRLRMPLTVVLSKRGIAVLTLNGWNDKSEALLNQAITKELAKK